MMRKIEPPAFQFGEVDISEIQFDLRSRDEIPKLLMGLQHIYTTPELREAVFKILETMIPKGIDPNNGRPGMYLWRILVLAVLRLNCNWDYDKLQEMANNHQTLRQMLGHAVLNQEYYPLQTLKDNVSLLTPELLDQINQLVVKAGHKLVKKKDETLQGRCDSFVVETDVHYPTDINLLFDAMRKVIILMAQLYQFHGLMGWRQWSKNVRDIKKLFRKAQKLKHSTSKDPQVKEARQQAIQKAHQAYLDGCHAMLQRVQLTIDALAQHPSIEPWEFAEINQFVVHAKRQIDQIQRRVIEGETIPHEQKVFSLFEEHSEWISKGKAGVPQELGLKVCVLEDQNGFILHHQVMQQLTDEQVAVPMIQEAQNKFPELKSCSFDKGFHSPTNQIELKKLLDVVILPKKGKLSLRDQQREWDASFLQARHQHSAVESAINALENHGLDRCPDHGIEGFTRYVALAVLGRNLQKLGDLIQQQQLKREQKKRFKIAA